MLFIDLYALSDAATDDALEHIYKSTHDRDEGIWKPHESPLLRRMIELFSKRGLDRLDVVKQQLIDWEEGANHHPSPTPVAVPDMMDRWSKDELALVRIYLESLPPAQWTLNDHMMAVEYVVQRYLPLDEMKTEAEWLATKASLMGKVQANINEPVTVGQADHILAALPSTVASASTMFHMKPAQKLALEFGAMHCVENVRALTEDVRHKLRNTIMQHAEEQMQGNAGGSLQTRLFDEFATHNRDWRRIAVTEAGNCQLNGYIASLEPGTKVKRVEQYDNACSFCRGIDGKIATVVPADQAIKDPEKEIWVGKSNVGRSAAPRKRVGNVLVARDPSEMYWLPAGLAHPHCRGRWVHVVEDEPGDDPEFGKWLQQALGGS
jgi:hypothetical protein